MKQTRKTSWRFILLLFLCALVLTACGEKQHKDDTIIYIPEFIDVTHNLDSVYSSCVIEERVYLWGGTNSKISIASVSEEDNSAVPLPDYQQITPPDIPNIAFTQLQWYFGFIQADLDGTIWEMVPMQVNTQIEESYSREIFYVIRRLDQNGKELFRLDIPERDILSQMDIASETARVRNFSVDKDGTIYFVIDSNVAVLDREGNLLFILPVPKDVDTMGYNSVIVLSDGRIGVRVERGHTLDEMETCLRVINKETRDWDEAILLAPGDNVFIYTGDANTLFYYRVANSLYAWREDAAEGEYLLNLIDSGINTSALSDISIRPDGRLILAGSDVFSNDFQLTYLTPTPAGQLGKTVLTLATFWMSPELQQAVQKFNQTNGKYCISVMDYSQYGDGNAAITRMVTEIGAGEMPDILDIKFSHIMFQNYLEDLWPYIDSDSELGREKLMVRALESEEVDGKLFSIGSTFRMYSYTGLTSVVGSRTTWTLDEMRAAMPEGSVPFFGGRERMLEALMGLGVDRFVDAEAGTCRFDSDEFKDILAFCAGMPERTAAGQAWYDAYRDGEVVLLPFAISDFYFPQYARYIFGGGEVSCVGIPNNWGLTGSSIGLTENLAMSNTCEHKDAVWAFLRTRLLPQVPRDKQAGDYYSDFPINKSDFDLMAQQAMTPEFELALDGTYALNSKGEKIEKEVFGGYQEAGLTGLHYYAATQADYDQIMALYNTIESSSAVDSDILAIITEVSGAYFAGDMTLDRAAELIQNRANLCVNERLQ